MGGHQEVIKWSSGGHQEAITRLLDRLALACARLHTLISPQHGESGEVVCGPSPEAHGHRRRQAARCSERRSRAPVIRRNGARNGARRGAR